MKMSYIVCQNCGAIVPYPWRRGLPTDDEAEFSKLLQQVRAARVECPNCGGHKWIRRVASKV
jgi:DNA-directed RNA polymerase subunit RPC12/RpoP